jgi:hypothetical protein
MDDIDKENNICLFLEKKILLTTQYLSATKEMKEALIQKEENNIINFISKRQDCMNKINKIDISLQKVIRPGSDRFSAIFNNYLARIKNLLEQIAPIDAGIIHMVKVESRSIKEELLKMNNIRYAAKGYGVKEKQTPRYLDARR